MTDKPKNPKYVVGEEVPLYDNFNYDKPYLRVMRKGSEAWVEVVQPLFEVEEQEICFRIPVAQMVAKLYQAGNIAMKDFAKECKEVEVSRQ